MTSYQPDDHTKCPYCGVLVQLEDPDRNCWFQIWENATEIKVTGSRCPSCGRAVIAMVRHEVVSDKRGGVDESIADECLLWPAETVRPIPPEVPGEIAQDYNEAARTLAVSPKASAALSRRCLQAVLRDKGYDQRDLAVQIRTAVPNLPAHIAQSLDHIRHVGNFAAHPTKETSTGQIVDVEPGEAEWNLDVLDMLFDFCYVGPAKAQQKRDALNAKLQAAGKPPMK